MDGTYRFLSKRRGSGAIVINRGRILLVKRRWLPIGALPGAWTFVGGKSKRGESRLDTMYRELMEETGLRKDDLKLLKSLGAVMLFDPVRRDYRWLTHLYLFSSNTDRIRLNFEHTKFRWAGYGDLARHRLYTNIIFDEKEVLRTLREAIKKDINR